MTQPDRTQLCGPCTKHLPARATQLQLDYLASLHIKAGAFPSVDETALFVEALAGVYNAYLAKLALPPEPAPAAAAIVS